MASQNFTASGTYTAGASKILVQVWGGGAGSGAGSATNGGGGGGGGAFSQTNLVTVVNGNNYTVVVGAQVAAATAGNQSYFTTTGVAPTTTAEGALAKGGGAGGAGGVGSNGTAGAAGSTTGAIGDTKVAGGAGVAGQSTSGGGGGGGAGTTGAGGSGTTTTGGTGTSVGGGNGGNGGGAAGAGVAGSTIGGGGGGGGSVAGAGATGARGEVRITEILEANVSDSIKVGESRYPGAVMASTPAAYWPFDETTGTTATDVSGNGNNGTYVASPTLGSASLLAYSAGTAVTFAKASSQYMSATDLDLTYPFSLEAWVKFSSLPSSGSSQYIINKSPTGITGYLLVGRASDNKISFGYGDGASTVAVISSTVVATGTTYHIVGTVDSNAFVTLYINNAVVASGQAGLTQVAPNANNVQVGRLASSTSYFDGVIDEPAIYSRALTAQEVDDHYKAGTQAPKLLLNQPINVSDSTTLTEATQFRVDSFINKSDSITVSENKNLTQVFNAIASDIATVSEATGFTLVLNASVQDSATISESLKLLEQFFINKTDSTTITESFGFTLVSNVNVSENLASGTPPAPVPSTYILLDNGVLAVLVANVTPYPLYQRL